MVLNPIQVALLFGIVIIIVMLVRNQSYHEQADRLARQFCQRNHLQFLDGTVSFRGMKIELRQFHICRSFRFDYSLDKMDRHHGMVTLCGQHIQSFRINTDHIENSESKFID